MDVFEITQRERVPGFRACRLLVVLPEIPLLVLVESVLFDELVLLATTGLMFAPVASFVENVLSILDEPLPLMSLCAWS
jgi:hypothetical protein